MRKSKKKFVKRHVPHVIVIASGAIFFICVFFIMRQFDASKTNAQQSIACPSPALGQQGLQLQPCYPAVTRTVPPTMQPTIVPRPTTRPPNPSDPCAGIGTIQTVNIDANGKETKSSGCDSKPVILLYPTTDTEVSVRLKLPGKLLVSIPDYPVGAGWQNILAHPNGILVYQGKEYKELFYEASQQNLTPPENGFIVKKENLPATLINMSTKLGLTHSEQQEFLSYWLSRLNTLQTPYVFVSVFSPEQQKLIDQVSITPAPDTFINFTMYYKGVTSPYAVKPLNFPMPPVRKGFTAVRWGGILDH